MNSGRKIITEPPALGTQITQPWPRFPKGRFSMPDFDPIGTVAFFRERQRVETITTGKVLRAMTPEMLDHRLHPESLTLGAIAWTIVRCLRLCNQLTHRAIAEVPQDPLPSHEQLVLAFDRTAHELSSALLV